ncbi:MAG: CvpA family protein [Oscillospiraceae bacterium]|nr:CvpA family protein [Oscillospiraceae bacterium]
MNVNWNDPDFQGFAKKNPFQKDPAAPKKARKAIGSPFGRTVINLVVTVLFAAVYYYVVLPPINLHSGDFYTFLVLTCGVYVLCAMLTSGFQGTGAKGYFQFLKKQCAIPASLAALAIVVAIVGSVAGWHVFRAAAYRDLLTVEEGDFAAEVEEISYRQIPMLDRDSATKLGNRKLGELADMVSQFEVAADYTQINYQGQPVRVTPLEYGDWIKWLNNRAKGLPAYLVIDMVTQNVDVVRLDDGIRYTTAEHFSRNLYRYLRFRYPTYIFDAPAFEIDEQGNPWWVCPRMTRTIGLFGGTDIIGAVLVNAVTGEHSYYDVADVPEWVDHVFTAELIIRQYDYHGRYINGWLNSMFGQRNVTETTDGYNYIAIDDDVYMYTGITSVVSDESNIGFILSNQRTKETRFYSVAGAEEYSAMDSAQGQVQQMRYTATFPLLLNISRQPTYFMALKDAAGLVKMYAMVNVSQYQIVATGATVAECESNYRVMLLQNGLIEDDTYVSPVEEEALYTVTGTVAEIRSAVVEGNTHFYLRLSGDDRWFEGSVSDVAVLPLMNVGDKVELVIYAAAGGVAEPIHSATVVTPAAAVTPAVVTPGE